MLYISDNIERIKNLNIKEKVGLVRDKFYINCCEVLDKYINNRKNLKKELCNNDEIVNHLYYERDKHSAHKDGTYISKDYESIKSIAEEMKTEIEHVKNVCSSVLPDNITLEFVSYDGDLFRTIHRITPEKEELILSIKHPFRNTIAPTDGIMLKIFGDTEDINKIKDKSGYGILMKNGICIEEGLQNRQDGMIKMNVLYNSNVWCTLNKENYNDILELRKLGVLNEYDILQPFPKDPIIQNRIFNILEPTSTE